ncbi:hypothetical protein TEA_027713 [Camellia sinensis var. sinensis]|uniref:Uncharacterized protein n=1 Tax=Camellia sinensis var. sinensis TaxID=542762 RepID=A0A4S4DPR5_CAMSN|nr:hypothetical protein TEA_027713 [Camellia sinensis var. sinensis]
MANDSLCGGCPVILVQERFSVTLASMNLVIFTNESNIDRWKNKRQVAVDSKIGRLNNFIKHVTVPIQKFCKVLTGNHPCQVFIACGIGKSDGKAEDPFRKPKPGMWHLMEQHFNSGISIDMDQSFYVGDAAGRKDDHSDADIKFAQFAFQCADTMLHSKVNTISLPSLDDITNMMLIRSTSNITKHIFSGLQAVGLKFYVPEEYFDVNFLKFITSTTKQAYSSANLLTGNHPCQVFIACGIGKSDGKAEDPFRKPKPGMWHLMEQHFNSGISIDMDQSFYVGDAAGRKDDHSDADIKFAQFAFQCADTMLHSKVNTISLPSLDDITNMSTSNITKHIFSGLQAVGLKFYVPEEYFDVK